MNTEKLISQTFQVLQMNTEKLISQTFQVLQMNTEKLISQTFQVLQMNTEKLISQTLLRHISNKVSDPKQNNDFCLFLVCCALAILLF